MTLSDSLCLFLNIITRLVKLPCRDGYRRDCGDTVPRTTQWQPAPELGRLPYTLLHVDAVRDSRLVSDCAGGVVLLMSRIDDCLEAAFDYRMPFAHQFWTGSLHVAVRVLTGTEVVYLWVYCYWKGYGVGLPEVLYTWTARSMAFINMNFSLAHAILVYTSALVT